MHYAWWGGWWWIWWLVWILIILWLVGLWGSGARRQRIARLTPIEVLQQRLAHGDITVEEYEQRRAILQRDQPPPPPSAPGT